MGENTTVPFGRERCRRSHLGARCERRVQHRGYHRAHTICGWFSQDKTVVIEWKRGAQLRIDGKTQA